MTNRNGGSKSRGKSYSETFPIEVATWLAGNSDLIDALLALRDLADERGAPEAIEAVGAIRRVAILRTSFELWCALVEGDGEDAEKLLLERLPFHVLERTRRAIWGPSWGEQDGTWLRVVPS